MSEAIEAIRDALKVTSAHDYRPWSQIEQALTAALPRLRAGDREEIARALAKPITGFPFDMLLEEQQAELLKAADAVCALSSAAGQEWREIIEDARRYRRLQILGCAPMVDHLKKDTVLRFSNLDEAIDADLKWMHSRGEAKPLPAPPVAEPQGVEDE